MSFKRYCFNYRGAGFIGSHTIDLFLSKGFKVRSIDNLSGGNLKNIEHLKKKNFEFVKGDILKLEKIKTFINECNYVVHFAGIGDIVPSIEDPRKYILNNANGTLNLLENIDAKKINKFVYAASSSCYGLGKNTNKRNRSNKHIISLCIIEVYG